MNALFEPSTWAGLLTLTVLEIVLGVDNLVFLAVTSARLRPEQQASARIVGLSLALVLRVTLLLALTWIAAFTAPLAEIAGFALSWRDVVYGIGGLYLIYKGAAEIHEQIEGEGAQLERRTASYPSAILQIMLLDVVFSIDSIVTAVGMTSDRPVMITAIVIAIGVMMFAAGPVSGFIEQHPTVKTLAFSFLLLVGMALVADGMHFHIPRGYIYFAIAFAILVEALNMAARRRGGGSE